MRRKGAVQQLRGGCCQGHAISERLLSTCFPALVQRVKRGARKLLALGAQTDEFEAVKRVPKASLRPFAVLKMPQEPNRIDQLTLAIAGGASARNEIIEQGFGGPKEISR